MLSVEKAFFARMEAEGEDGQLPGMFVPLRPPQPCLQWEEGSRNWNQKEVGNKETLVQSYSVWGVKENCSRDHEIFLKGKHSGRKHCCWQVTKSCLTQSDPMDCSPPGSSVHGIFQARILEQVAIPFPRGSSWCRDWTHVSCVSCIGSQILYHWATREAQ